MKRTLEYRGEGFVTLLTFSVSSPGNKNAVWIEG